MLRGGINVCLGTDSAASAGDVSILAEAAYLFAQPGSPPPPRTVWDMITWRGADALGRPDFGRMERGSRDALYFFRVAPRRALEDELAEILQGSIRPMPREEAFA
jgi:cytosine/adenosine deaminase-related metal-dependent hydrolase